MAEGTSAILLIAEDGRDILVQSTDDYVGVASTFGWVPCECGATDGSIPCRPCNRDPSHMYEEAVDFLLEVQHREDPWIEDPGYFG